MDKIPEGPLGAAGAAKPKLLVGKLKTSLKRERKAICHYPLQHLGDAREEADRAVPFGEARVPARFGHCQNLCAPPLAREKLTLKGGGEECDEMGQQDGLALSEAHVHHMIRASSLPCP